MTGVISACHSSARFDPCRAVKTALHASETEEREPGKHNHIESEVQRERERTRKKERRES